MNIQDLVSRITLDKGTSLLEYVKNATKAQMEEKKGDADLLPMLFLTCGDVLTMIAIMPHFMQNPTTKDKLFKSVLPSLVLEMNADQFIFMSPAWMVMQSTEGMSEEEIKAFLAKDHAPSKSPQRQEVIILNYGDAENALMSNARITRNGADQKATLGPWTDMPGGEQSGRGYESLMAAMQFNRNPDRALGAKIIRDAIGSDFGRMPI